MPKDAVSGVRVPLTGYASLNQIIFHDFQYIYYPKLLEGSCANFLIPQLFSKQILLPDYLRVTSMNSNYYPQSELPGYLEAQNLLQQSSESRKIRGEADVIST